MSRILNVNDMLDAALDSSMPNGGMFVTRFEALAAELSNALANHLGVDVMDEGTYEQGYAGLCAAFVPREKGQPCPEVLEAGDPGGDWGDDDEDEV